MNLAALGLLLKDHWPKILAAILVPVLIATIGLYFADRERDETQAEERLVKTGKQEVTIEHQERTLRNVEKANDAVADRDNAAVAVVRSKYDRCADPAACQ